jgi:hypothetical protein
MNLILLIAAFVLSAVFIVLGLVLSNSGDLADMTVSMVIFLVPGLAGLAIAVVGLCLFWWFPTAQLIVSTVSCCASLSMAGYSFLMNLFS